MEETDLTTVRARARVGTLLNGRWHLDKLVGVGGMAAVYAATHRNGKRVAVKILHPEISVDDNARQRFLREGYAANQVGHRGAVAADDDGTTEDGITFLVMELLEGETIEERSARHGGKLPATEVLALMDQTLATLVAAHAKGIVHRDLKPENLFLTHEGIVKVLDFGIARVHDSLGKSPSQTQGIMGTPSFMAPEQARGRWEDVDARTDLWAIGATMFTLLSGRVVHEAETANEALVLAVTQRAPALLLMAPHVHPAVAALVDQALGYEREQRFQTAWEFRDAVRATHATLTGDDSLPLLAVPKVTASSVSQPGPLSLTATEGGVAASVRSGQATRIDQPKRSAKAPLVVLAVAALALLGVLGRGWLLGTSGKAPAIAVETRASAAGHAADDAQHVPSGQPPSGAAVTSSAVSMGSALPAAALVSATSEPRIAKPPLARAVAARSASPVGSPSAAAPKPRASKPASDPFKKRH